MPKPRIYLRLDPRFKDPVAKSGIQWGLLLELSLTYYFGLDHDTLEPRYPAVDPDPVPSAFPETSWVWKTQPRIHAKLHRRLMAQDLPRDIVVERAITCFLGLDRWGRRDRPGKHARPDPIGYLKPVKTSQDKIIIYGFGTL